MMTDDLYMNVQSHFTGTRDDFDDWSICLHCEEDEWDPTIYSFEECLEHGCIIEIGELE